MQRTDIEEHVLARRRLDGVVKLCAYHTAPVGLLGILLVEHTAQVVGRLIHVALVAIEGVRDEADGVQLHVRRHFDNLKIDSDLRTVT